MISRRALACGLSNNDSRSRCAQLNAQNIDRTVVVSSGRTYRTIWCVEAGIVSRTMAFFTPPFRISRDMMKPMLIR
jgi:hypothetical protein